MKYYYRAGLLSTVFSHVINAVRKEHLRNISLIYAHRHFVSESKESKTILPFLYLRKRNVKMLEISKNSLTPISNPEWKKMIKVIKEEGFGDLTVTQLALISKNENLKNILEEVLKKKIVSTPFVYYFKHSTRSAREPYIKRDLFNVMKEYVEKLGLKYATLELQGIYTLQDWKSQKKHNLLHMDNLDIDKKTMKEIIENIFYPTLRVKGKEIKIRFVKWYTVAKGNVLKLAGYEKV